MRKPNTSLRDDEAPLTPIVQLPSSRVRDWLHITIMTNVLQTDRLRWSARQNLQHRMKERPDKQAITLDLRCYDENNHFKEHSSGETPDLSLVKHKYRQ